MREFDTALLHFINRDLANPIFDFFFPIWTDIQKNPLFLILFIPTFLIIVYVTKNYRMLKITVFALLATFIADKINHYLIKAYFARPRPSGILLKISAQSSFSFPSGHAVNAFCLATMLSLFYPRKKIIFFLLATLTAFSRIYNGVHYPGDVLAGALVGSSLAYIGYKILMSTKLKSWFVTLLFFIVGINSSFAWEDPTKGKPFFKWAWEDQFKPTLKKSIDDTGLIILGSGAATSVVVHQYDDKIYHYNNDHRVLFDEKSAQQFGKFGNGIVGVGIATTQLILDQDNGLKHFRALILTTTSHMAVAAIVQRDRPNNKTDFLPFPSSYPSGHTASAFATAGALAYSYGWTAGVPAYIVASSISISRIREARHWASDIVAGATLGTFWARASYKADDKKESTVMIIPSPIYDGMMISAIKEF